MWLILRQAPTAHPSQHYPNGDQMMILSEPSICNLFHHFYNHPKPCIWCIKGNCDHWEEAMVWGVICQFIGTMIATQKSDDASSNFFDQPLTTLPTITVCSLITFST
jgi:hypothetical protein